MLAPSHAHTYASDCPLSVKLKTPNVHRPMSAIPFTDTIFSTQEVYKMCCSLPHGCGIPPPPPTPSLPSELYTLTSLLTAPPFYSGNLSRLIAVLMSFRFTSVKAIISFLYSLV